MTAPTPHSIASGITADQARTAVTRAEKALAQARRDRNPDAVTRAHAQLGGAHELLRLVRQQARRDGGREAVGHSEVHATGPAAIAGFPHACVGGRQATPPAPIVAASVGAVAPPKCPVHSSQDRDHCRWCGMSPVPRFRHEDAAAAAAMPARYAAEPEL